MKFSIITVCLNSEETIEKTINSVLAQAYKDVEYIIIDGGSTDRTLEIVEKYRGRISKVVSEPDRGIYDAMNKGIQLATGDIVGIINSDDWYEKNAFYMVEKCFEEGAELVYGRMNIYRGERCERVLIPTNIQKIFYEMEVPHPTVFVKREIYERYGGFDEQYSVAADYDLVLKLYVNGVKFEYIDSVLANFRLGGISYRRNLICAEETLTIARQYYLSVPQERKEYISNCIEEKRLRYEFMKLLEENPEQLTRWVREKCKKSLQGRFVIFGFGKWGLILNKILMSNNFRPEFIVDNDPNKWNTYADGIRIVSPEKLETFAGLVFILARDFSKEICAQVKAINNSNLECIRWEEILE